MRVLRRKQHKNIWQERIQQLDLHQVLCPNNTYRESIFDPIMVVFPYNILPNETKFNLFENQPGFEQDFEPKDPEERENDKEAAEQHELQQAVKDGEEEKDNK